MTKWNVLVAVVEHPVEAPSELEAIRVVRARLRAAGFDTYDFDCSMNGGADAFESEDQS